MSQPREEELPPACSYQVLKPIGNLKCSVPPRSSWGTFHPRGRLAKRKAKAEAAKRDLELAQKEEERRLREKHEVTRGQERDVARREGIDSFPREAGESPASKIVQGLPPRFLAPTNQMDLTPSIHCSIRRCRRRPARVVQLR